MPAPLRAGIFCANDGLSAHIKLFGSFKQVIFVSFMGAILIYLRHQIKQSKYLRTMKKIFTSGLLAGVVLLIAGYAALYVVIMLFPGIAEEYYSPTFREGSTHLWMYLAHPFIMAITFSWFWENFKTNIQGSLLYRGVWVGLIYGAVALLPAMWLTFSSLDISLKMVLSWYVYGLFQACVAGLIFAKTNP